MLIGWIKMNQVVRFCSHTIISSAKFFNFTIGHFGVPWAPHLPGLPLSVSVELKQTPNNILQKTIQRDERMEQKRRNGRRILCVCVCAVWITVLIVHWLNRRRRLARLHWGDVKRAERANRVHWHQVAAARRRRAPVTKEHWTGLREN